LRLQQEADAPTAAASLLWIPKRILDDPFVDRPGFLDVGTAADGDFRCRRFYDAISWKGLCRPKVIAQLSRVGHRRLHRRGEINRVIPGSDPAGESENRFHSGRKFS